MDNYIQKYILLILVFGVTSGCAMWDRMAKNYYYSQHPEARMQEHRQEVVNQHPEWPEQVQADVLAGTVRIGMTQEQVLASLGNPYDVNRTVGSWGVHEQWIYGYYQQDYAFTPSLYLYIEDGILTSFQD